MSVTGYLYRNKLFFLVAFICVVSRIPELISNNLILDGDECVVAIMAKHLMTGNAFSAFFYGQAYGFSLVECLFIIPFYFIFGITTLSVKLGMLALWITGVLFLYQSFRLINKGPKWLPLLFILIFIWSPAWAVWSIKARGGYLTAFTLTSIVLCLLFSGKKSPAATSCIGIMFVFIYQSKSIWIPGLVPFLAFFLLKDKNKKQVLFFLIPVLLLSIGAWYYKQGMLEFGVYEADYSPDNLWPRISRIPVYLYDALHGNFFLSGAQKPNLFCAVQAIAFELLALALPLVAVSNIIKRKKDTLLFNISACAILLSLLLTVCAEGIKCRFLLPITGYVLLSFLLLLNNVNINKEIFYKGAYLYLALGIVSLITFYNFSFFSVKEKDLKNVLAYIENKGVHYAYCTDNMFTWQVIFYSNEQLLCHERRLPGRFPKYVWKVDSAYYSGAKTVYIAQPGFPSEINFPHFETVAGYYIVFDPPKDIMAKEFPPMINIYPLLAIPLAAFVQYVSERQFFIKLIFSFLFIFFIAINISYSFQEVKGILVSEESNATYNLHMLFKMNADYNDMVMYDVQQVQPQNNRIEKVSTLACENYEDSLSDHFVPDPTKKSRYVYYMHNDEEYHPEKIVVTYNKEQFKNAGWLKCSGNFLCPKPYLYFKHLFVLDILRGEKTISWNGCKIDNKIGLTGQNVNNSEFTFYHSALNKWGNVYFFVRIPDGLVDGDKIRLDVWNIGKQEMYFDDICLELYKDK